jgi:hypothetical protein
VKGFLGFLFDRLLWGDRDGDIPVDVNGNGDWYLLWDAGTYFRPAKGSL